MRTLYRLLSSLGTGRAASRGPGSLTRNVVRRQTYRSVSRSMRRWGL